MVTACLVSGCSAEQPRAAPGPTASPAVESSPAPSPSSSEHLERAVSAIREIAQEAVESSTAPGVAVLVRQGSSVEVVTEGTRDTTEPFEPDTPFAVGSVTKTMVATAAVRLHERGVLDLDDTVQRWLPGLLPGSPEVTVEQLLNHSSGLFNVTDDPSFWPGRQAPEEVVALALDHGMRFRPGARLEYSNTGYVVLGMVLEEAGDQPLGRLLDREVFDPAGMEDTSLATRYPAGAARGYEDGEDVTLEQLHAVGAAGAVVSTLRDVDAFFQALFDGDLVSAGSLRLMLETQRMAVGFEAYGLGLAAADLRCGTAYGHAGELPGLTTRVWVLPVRDRSTVAMVNTDSVHAPMDSLTDEALCG